MSKKSQGKGRHDWKRRFFVLDSTGLMYYYSHKVVQCPIICVQSTHLLHAALLWDVSWDCQQCNHDIGSSSGLQPQCVIVLGIIKAVYIHCSS